jgi:hypothetical protein
VFENKVLRRICGPKRDEIIGDWKNFRNELHNLYLSPNIVTMMKSRKVRWTRHVANVEGGGNVYRILLDKSEGKKPLGRLRHGLEGNI